MNTTTTYDTETSSVDCACYGNGTSIKYEYDDADRVDIIRHRTGSTQFLIVDCEYDPANNRLTEYEVRVIGTTGVVERVVYDYFKAEDKAGNVRRVGRKVADVPGPDPFNWTVYGTDFDYHRNGELRMIIQRTWRDDGGTVSDDQLVSIHEVRGQGRKRYMLRPWGFEANGQGGWNTWADNASALWTAYDGDEPTVDYRMIDHPTLGTVPYPENSYTLGLAQRTPEGAVKYFHTDHLGTTQGMTDASQAVNPRIIYTAFGELISTEGIVETRFQYVGKDGYETFDALPFVHVGARWYDPGAGRFVQRDPIGIRGGFNVYEYCRSLPVAAIDPTGHGDNPRAWDPRHRKHGDPGTGGFTGLEGRHLIEYRYYTMDGGVRDGGWGVLHNLWDSLIGANQPYDDSFLDDPKKVKTAQVLLQLPSFACGGVGFFVRIPTVGRVLIWGLNGVRLGQDGYELLW